MKIIFALDEIIDLEKLYTYTSIQDDFIGGGIEEHYHGTEYTNSIMADIVTSGLSLFQCKTGHNESSSALTFRPKSFMIGRKNNTLDERSIP